MFSSALKSFSSNISSNYSVSSSPSCQSGPWKIYDAKKKSTGKVVSVFVFDRKSLESHANSLGRTSASSLKRAIDEVAERLKKEVSCLARLRHPNILELVEPIEETRSGGLQFATEAVTASLSGLLKEQDDKDRGEGRGWASRRTTGESNGTGGKEVELDELEIQKGLLQISKALEFLHDNAGLVHANLTPDAVFINAKSDWKISGLSFASPPPDSDKPTSVIPISLAESLNVDARLPKSVQLNLDFASPDFVFDNNVNTSADMFSLGILIISLYNSPRKSPLDTHSSVSMYKKIFSSPSTIPSVNNEFLCRGQMPKELTHTVLPRLITRRPAQRMNAKEFQQSAYFDNILVSTIRFLESLPAKTPNEKAQFMRGLPKIVPSFPKSVMERKLLPALLEEMKDKDLVSLILANVFKIIQLLPSGRKAFTEKIMPRLTEIFVVGGNSKAQERDPARDAALMVILENIKVITENCSGKEFKEGILPIINVAIESPTHPLVDAALRTLPTILQQLDYTTIKNELFPVIASVFAKTSSLGIKVRGLEAFVILCGGTNDGADSDGLNGMSTAKKNASTILDKYTMQEKVVPLIKAIKTKEPAVMMAALNVLCQIGTIADNEFIAFEVLPILWNMSLGPLLNLKQFQAFTTLIKSLSVKVEEEHTKKLQELSGLSNGSSNKGTDDFMSFESIPGFGSGGGDASAEDDFETLVKGKASNASSNPLDSGWDTMPKAAKQQTPASSTKTPVTFSWSTPNTSPAPIPSVTGIMKPQTVPQTSSAFRTVTPDYTKFEAMKPSNTQFSQPLQPTQKSTPAFSPPSAPLQLQTQPSTSVNWGAAMSNPWNSTGSSTPSAFPASNTSLNTSMSSMSLNQQQQQQHQPRPQLNSSFSSFSLPPPPSVGATFSGSIAPPPMSANSFQGIQSQIQPSIPLNSAFGGMYGNQASPAAAQSQKKGLDAYESLL